MTDRHAALRAMLRTLKLPAIADLFADLAVKAAKQGLTHEAYLFEVVQAELAQRDAFDTLVRSGVTLGNGPPVTMKLRGPLAYPHEKERGGRGHAAKEGHGGVVRSDPTGI